MANQQKKIFATIILTILVVSVLVSGVEMAKIMIQGYQNSGMMGVFAIIGLLFTMYVIIYMIQQGHRKFVKRHFHKNKFVKTVYKTPVK